jgi:hypothetical protein
MAGTSPAMTQKKKDAEKTKGGKNASPNSMRRDQNVDVTRTIGPL